MRYGLSSAHVHQVQFSQTIDEKAVEVWFPDISVDGLGLFNEPEPVRQPDVPLNEYDNYVVVKEPEKVQIKWEVENESIK